MSSELELKLFKIFNPIFFTKKLLKVKQSYSKYLVTSFLRFKHRNYIVISVMSADLPIQISTFNYSTRHSNCSKG